MLSSPFLYAILEKRVCINHELIGNISYSDSSLCSAIDLGYSESLDLTLSIIQKLYVNMFPAEYKLKTFWQCV